MGGLCPTQPLAATRQETNEGAGGATLSLKMTPSYPESPSSSADLKKPLRKESLNLAHLVMTLGKSSRPQFVHFQMRGLEEMPEKGSLQKLWAWESAF